MARKRYYTPDNPDGVIPSRLRRLGRAAQLEYLEAWFRDYYEEPVNETPSSDGEYHFIWGGPYDPYDELWNEFGGIVPEDRIQELANKLRLEWVEWAPSALKQQELGTADEALAFPMWPSEPRARGRGTHSPAASTEEGAEAKDELTAEYVPPQVVELGGRGRAISAGSGHLIVERAPEPDAATLAANTEQRPAAYRFRLHDGKIDVLPEPPETEEREFALDTYAELVAKVRELHERLKGTNSALRVCNSVKRLLTALGTQFDDLRPGVLLSRSRSIEADRTAFGDELSPDTIAMMDGTLQTLRDLLAGFPIVRRIEAERLALNLDRNADAISAIQREMDAVRLAAAQSGAVTEEAINALAQNDAAIEDAIDPVLRTSLIADNLLVFRNFAGAVIGGIARSGRIAIAKVGPELAGLGGDIWKEIRGRLPNGVGLAVMVAPLFLLADQISDPYLRIGATVPAFTPVANVLRKAIADSLKAALAGKANDKPQRKGHGKNG